MEYVNLDLELSKYQRDSANQETFCVHVVRSYFGAMSSDKAVPVTLTFEQRYRIGQLKRRGLTKEEMIERGEELGKMLFPPHTQVRQIYDHCLDGLKEGQRLRIRLTLGDYGLSDLPWEYAYILPPDTPIDQKDRRGFLVLNRQISLVRYSGTEQKRVSLDPLEKGTLRMVVIMASPKNDPVYRDLELEKEFGKIQRALKEVPEIVLEAHSDATIEMLHDALMKPAHIFHFTGHGRFETHLGAAFRTLSGNGYIILLDEEGKGHEFPADKLASLLHASQVRLAVFTASETGSADQINAWTGVVPALIRAGIPAVVGMQFTIEDKNAIAFSRQFYLALAEGLPIDAAVAEGRQAIYIQGKEDERDWGVPVLYLQDSTGVLFPFPEKTAEDEHDRLFLEVREGEKRESTKFRGSKNHAPQDEGAEEEKRNEKEPTRGIDRGSRGKHQPLVEEKIRLDVHTPETVEVQKTFEVGVAIRQPESPLPEESGMPKVASKAGRIFREKSEDIVRYRVRVSAPDCEVHTGETVFLLRAGTDSETHYFQLTARKAGLVSILVQAYQEDGILAADTRISVTATLEAKPVEVRPMRGIRYKNLDLELFDYQKGADHTEHFRVRVIDSPSGQQKPSDAEKVTLPADVRRRLQMLQDRSLTLLERIERGEVLANLLFPPRARWYLDHSRSDDDERLRIRLRFDNYSLVDLPWEFAYIAKPDTPPGQKGADGFLVLDRKISLVRFEIMGQAMVSVDPVGPGPLRMAIVMANPDDPGLTKLNLEAERKSMEEVLEEIPIIHPKFYPNATLEKLEDALTGDLHAFHFAGHGGFEGDLGVAFGSQEGKGFVVLEDQDHRPFKFPAEKLALNLAGRGVRLAVLGSCEGGRRDQVNAWTGVAPALTRAGIPAVVGMQFKVLDENAIAFSRKFYRALAAGESVDAAVTDARLAIFNRGGDEERDWAVLVLYLRAEEGDGVLFPKAGGGSPQPQVEQRPRDLIDVYIRLAQDILSANAKIEEKSPSPARREAIAKYYQKISNTLKHAETELRAGNSPSGDCDKMREYAEQLPNAIGDFVGKETARELSDRLLGAYRIEGLLMDLQNLPNRGERLRDLAKAAAYFEVAADSLLAT